MPADVTATRTARGLAASARGFRQAANLGSATAAIVDDVEDAAEDIMRLNAKIADVQRQLRTLVQEAAPSTLGVYGASVVVSAGLIGHAGDMRYYRNSAAFAAKCGAAPVPCSSGRNVAVRVNAGGDRQMNRLLHVIAMSQVMAAAHPGREYYERKRAEGKTHLAAMRCVKRQLATVMYYRLKAVQDAVESRATATARAA